jgi:hypothetical protein
MIMTFSFVEEWNSPTPTKTKQKVTQIKLHPLSCHVQYKKTQHSFIHSFSLKMIDDEPGDDDADKTNPHRPTISPPNTDFFDPVFFNSRV